jgi:hypothetical protein
MQMQPQIQQQVQLKMQQQVQTAGPSTAPFAQCANDFAQDDIFLGDVKFKFTFNCNCNDSDNCKGRSRSPAGMTTRKASTTTDDKACDEKTRRQRLSCGAAAGLWIGGRKDQAVVL